MKKVKLGFIGAGFISQLAHLPSFYSDSRARIIALCDLNNKLLSKVSKKFQIPKIYNSHKEMLKKEKLDGVVLVVQRKNTELIARDVLRAKIALFSEKPSALSYSSAKKLSDLAKKNKTKYFIGYMKRHDNGIIFLKKNLKKFKLGKLRTAYYESFPGAPGCYCDPFEHFKHTKNYIKKITSYEKLNKKKFVFLKYLNSFCHSINLTRYLFGEVKLDHNALTDTGEGHILLRTKNGIGITINCQYTNFKKWVENITLNFDKGKILIKLPAPFLKNTSASVLVENYENGNTYKPWIPWGWSFRNQAKSFVKYISSNKLNGSKCTANDSLNDIKIIESIFKN